MDNGTQDGSEGTEDGLDPAALARVRRELAGLAADEASAPDVPPEVTDRVLNTLRSEPAHTVRRPPLRRWQLLALIVGLSAAVGGVVVGAVMLSRPDVPTFPAGPTAQMITVDRPVSDLPLPDSEIIDLLSQPPDYGPLTDPRRRGSCLGGLGYPPSTAVLGARTMDLRGQPAVLMLLPGDSPESVLAVVVEPGCNGAHTGLLAKSSVART